MYQITQLKPDSIKFVSEINTSNRSRSLAMSITVAKLLANSISLPTTEVDNLQLYYNTQSRLELEEKLYKLNELIVLDVKTISDLVMKFYQFRYNSLYPCCNVLAVKQETALVDFFRISKVFEQSIIDCINQDYMYITEMTTKLLRLFEDLKG